MLILSKFGAIAAVFVSLAQLAVGAPEPASLVREVFEAEKAFAQAGFDRGIRESFLQFFADESVLFAPGPTNGKAFYLKYVDQGRRLVWEPIFATVAASGEMGATTGPWHLEKSMTDNETIAFGDFVSIWRRQADKSWKVALDVGIDHANPPGGRPEIQLLLPTGPKDSKTAAEKSQALEKSESAFQEILKVDEPKAVIASAGEEIRVFRDNSFPAVGQDGARELLSKSAAGKVTRTRAGEGLSESNDLAYRYGSYAREDGGKAERGYFLSIWQLDKTGSWKLLLDLQKQEPPKE